MNNEPKIMGGALALVKPPVTNYELRPYQTELLAKIYQCWADGNKKVMAQLPTGGGKTILFSKLARASARNDQRVLVLAHREELILQAKNKLEAISGLPVGIIKNGYRPDYKAPIQVASVQTLANRLDQLEDTQLIVVDEAHHATAETYRKILGAYPRALVLGVTATPIRLDGSGFRDLFDELVCGITTSELIDQSSLSKYKMFADPEPMSTKGARQTGGDYSASSIAALNPALELAGSLIGSYERYANGKQCIVFAVDVASSRTIAEAYCLSGIPACHLDGNSSREERSEALRMFASGEIKVLSNCALFDEGLDIPSIEAVQIAKPTKSLGRYLQMLGRGLRPAPGKEHAILIDHTNCWMSHGLPTDEREWTLDGVEVKPKKKKTKRNKDGELVEVPILEPLKQVDIVDVDMVDITAQAEADKEAMTEFQRLVEVQMAKGYKQGWLLYQLKEKPYPLSVWRAFGKLAGYKLGWAWHQWEAQEDGINQAELMLG